MTRWSETREFLVRQQVRSVEEQQEIREEIISAFRVFWFGGPTEREFADTMRRIVLFPEILYIMCRGYDLH